MQQYILVQYTSIASTIYCTIDITIDLNGDLDVTQIQPSLKLLVLSISIYNYMSKTCLCDRLSCLNRFLMTPTNLGEEDNTVS